jgi:AraC-like DNA-binding protein
MAQQRGFGYGIDHRLRIVLPEPPGDDSLRLIAYGVRERIIPVIVEREGGTEDWLIMAFHTPARMWVDGQGMVDIAPDSLVVWRPLAPHRYGHSELEWTHSWLHLRGDLLAEWFDRGRLPLERPIAGIPCRLLDRCLLLLHDEVSHHQRPDVRILRNHLHTWLCAVERALVGEGASAPPGIRAARTAIESRYAEPLTLAELAALAGCSRQHLCVGYRRWFGVTPIDHLVQVRLHHAWLMLQDRRLPVAAVAEAVGFRDYRHFSRLFKRRFGRPARRRGTS